ncbi:hypothetical protein B566_EDAN008883 [Ephemera danica]|nr:hypothetical protein B566_EDAN008883 [Ephemera danica]
MSNPMESIKSVGEYCENQEESCSGADRYCRSCKMKQPLRSQHCSICDYCVIKWEYHCVWLDCCIGDCNISKYLLGLFFASIALFYGSYLTLTTVCHPFLVMDTILIPDDCSDVFFDTKGIYKP